MSPTIASPVNVWVADEVHGCYQEVIEHMLAEQERTRASLSQLLDIQSASLTKIGNQWPAFHELQVRSQSKGAQGDRARVNAVAYRHSL